MGRLAGMLWVVVLPLITWQMRAAAQGISQQAAATGSVNAAAKAGSSANGPAQADRSRVLYDSYILGPGDSLQIELLDIPELSGSYSIGPDGTIYLPRLRALYVEGLTVEELRYFVTQQFKAYVRNPQVYVRPVGYRPVRVYLGGEVRRPGFYTLSGQQSNDVSVVEESIRDTSSQPSGTQQNSSVEFQLAQQQKLREDQNRFRLNRGIGGSVLFPTVFDAIRTGQGITPFSDLSNVEVTRRQPLSSGGGKIRTRLNFLTLITQGDESQNIRLFDGDVVQVGRSPVVLREQLLKAGQTNLSPQFIQVYVSGRVKTPGGITVPQGASLTQAISLAGGTQLLKGKVEFIRFTREGEIDRRIFKFNPNAASDTPDNPVLMAGDVIRVQDSALSAGIGVLNELTGPFVGVYSVYSIFK